MGDKMIKNIVFDMGNVLLDYNPQNVLSKYIEGVSDQALIREVLFNSEEWYLKDKGEITKAQMFERMAKRVPERLQETLKNCLDNWVECMGPLKGARECVERMKKLGYKVYVLSNAGVDFYEYFPQYMNLEYFDGIVVSAFIHELKPEHEIYDYLLEQYNLEPEECLFIDDRQDNVEGALAVGMHALRFDGDYSVIEKYLL